MEKEEEGEVEETAVYGVRCGDASSSKERKKEEEEEKRDGPGVLARLGHGKQTH